MGADSLTEEPAGSPFAGMVFSNHPRRSRQPSGESGTHSALEIDAQIVAFGPQPATQSTDLPQRFCPKGGTSPVLCLYQVDAIH
jgi:hypothetical protein